MENDKISLQNKKLQEKETNINKITEKHLKEINDMKIKIRDIDEENNFNKERCSIVEGDFLNLKKQ